MADQATGLLSGLLRRKRLDAAKPFLRGRVLDYGCGVGELAPFCDPADYLGVDIDASSIALAQANHPRYAFRTSMPDEGEFDLIVLLAVIEHVPDPVELLGRLRGLLGPEGRIVMTTPHRRAAWLHTLGAKIRLFSREASDEHETLFDLAMMHSAAGRAGLAIDRYRRFLFGVNQLFVVVRA